MGLITSRFNHFNAGRTRRSQQEETLYSYSLNKNYFSNYFFMGGERFEVNDPDYLFGDNFDLNFLSCTKPHSFPYKQAQQNLIQNLNAKHNKSSMRKSNSSASSFSSTNNPDGTGGATSHLSRLRSPLHNLLPSSCRGNRASRNNSFNNKQHHDNSSSSRGKNSNGPSAPSQPIVMLVNIRKETLRLVKSTSSYNNDSDLDSVHNSSVSTTEPKPTAIKQAKKRVIKMLKAQPETQKTASSLDQSIKQRNSPKVSKPRSNSGIYPSTSIKGNEEHPRVEQPSSDTDMNDGPVCNIDENLNASNCNNNDPSISEDKLQIRDSSLSKLTAISGNSSKNSYDQAKKSESEISSLLSATSSIKSGYTSIKYQANYSDDDAASDDDDFKDALNDTSNVSVKDDLASTCQAQNASAPQLELTVDNPGATCVISIDSDQDGGLDEVDNSFGRESKAYDNRGISTFTEPIELKQPLDSNGQKTDKTTTRSNSLTVQQSNLSPSYEISSKSSLSKQDNQCGRRDQSPVYNLEFYFDCEVSCSIRIFYLCSREVGPNGVIYKPQHATYKSKVYHYKRGLNQKFDQPDHTFEPYLFDEDLLIYKPLDIDGNYNTGAVFPIVIHCIALEGPMARQSQSLIATIEKSQLDESYSIKPLKQLIFVDSVQYILQDIYGIENRQVVSSPSASSLNYLSSSCQTSRKTLNSTSKNNTRSRSKETASLGAQDKDTIEGTSTPDKEDPRGITTVAAGDSSKIRASQTSLTQSNLDCLSETSSLASVDFVRRNHRKSSFSSNNQFKSFGNESASECVICMSESRDTMLLPCRHLCLCSTCAQSLRYQANSCPICRCPFKAALNLRFVRRPSSSPSTEVKSTVSVTTASMVVNGGGGGSTKDEGASSNVSRKTALSEQIPSVCCRP